MVEIGLLVFSLRGLTSILTGTARKYLKLKRLLNEILLLIPAFPAIIICEPLPHCVFSRRVSKAD